MATDVTSLRVLRCRTGALDWALEERVVREVAAPVGVARVPGTGRAVMGLANLRGALVTVLDMGSLLGQEGGTAPEAFVVVEAGARVVALAVDEVDDLYEVPSESFSLVTDETGLPEGVIISRGQLDRPFLLLDPEALVEPLYAAAATA